MTPVQMQFNFIQGLSDILQYDFDISTIQIERFLNLSQDEFVDKWDEIFETSEAARKRLSPLVLTTNIDRISGAPSTSNAHPNGEYWTIPSNCRTVKKEEVTIATIPIKRIPVIPINLDYYNKHIKNSFKKPYTDLFWRMDGGNKKHELIGDGTQITIYHLTYLKNPAEIKILGTPVSCEISAEYHDEIVKQAINMALQTLTIKSNNKE